MIGFPRKKADGLYHLKYTYRGNTIEMAHLEYNELTLQIREIFKEEVYGRLPCKERVVVDIGANNGDTAIYFALNQAKKVYAYEPFANVFEVAKLNIGANNIENIVLANAAIGSVDRITYVDGGQPTASHTGTDALSSKGNKRTPVYSLASITLENHIEDASLKLDCEGGEYEIQ